MITEKEIKKISFGVLLLVLTVLALLVVRPVMYSVIGGLLFAYMFYPVHKFLVRYVKNASFAAALVSVLVLLVIIVPLYFLIPTIAQRVFELFQFSQNIDIKGLVFKLFPKASEQLTNQLGLAINNATSKLSSWILNSLVDFLVNFALIALHLILAAFVFFFGLRDGPKLGKFMSSLSPLEKTQEKKFVKQFQDITYSIMYGQIAIGILQGVLAGIGFYIFGVPNSLLLTAAAIFLSIIPFIGPGLIYTPIALYMLFTGSPPLAFAFFAYNVLVVSTIDNVVRSHLIARKIKTSQAVVLIGMIGGLLVFGILGFILGPLILEYFITFLSAYKEKTLSSFFASEP